jgi:hypothetical protein
MLVENETGKLGGRLQTQCSTFVSLLQFGMTTEYNRAGSRVSTAMNNIDLELYAVIEL